MSTTQTPPQSKERGEWWGKRLATKQQHQENSCPTYAVDLVAAVAARGAGGHLADVLHGLAAARGQNPGTEKMRKRETNTPPIEPPRQVRLPMESPRMERVLPIGQCPNDK